ncbi:hypothetical protein [Fibrella aquatilis]|uniref:Glycine zipper 2TM domain-containing protein n=1 Tax=Fibrella aquatilis TaxID=2817059 RepID=A0A939K1W3_9BACT|nr:hypothetical protein [Fibrella aquatilis]MBO0933476.1 hypothetical protein [Fibrella aquatilis]
MKTNQRLIALVLLAAFLLNSFAEAQSPRRRWTPEAKGVAIGAGVGGVAGALINKRNRQLGAGVGLAVGAAAGYGVGKVISNRHKRAAAAAQAAEQREYAARTAPAYHTERKRNAGFASHRAATPAATTRAALVAPAVAEAELPVLTKNGYLLNTAYGDPNSAYPNSEYRRKSW